LFSSLPWLHALLKTLRAGAVKRNLLREAPDFQPSLFVAATVLSANKNYYICECVCVFVCFCRFAEAELQRQVMLDQRS
jgi:hypothetical protein